MAKAPVVDEHGFLVQYPRSGKTGSGHFVPRESTKVVDFDGRSWESRTATTATTTSQDPTRYDSFDQHDNPFGYGYEERPNRSESPRRSTRSRRRASLSSGLVADQVKPERHSRRSRRSSMGPSSVPNDLSQMISSDILSSTTIDQGNGNRVCVVVFQMENDNEEKKAGERGSERQEHVRTGSSRSSRHRSESDRRPDRPRRRSSMSHHEKEESDHRPRRRASISHREKKEPDRPRRRSSISFEEQNRYDQEVRKSRDCSRRRARESYQ